MSENPCFGLGSRWKATPAPEIRQQEPIRSRKLFDNGYESANFESENVAKEKKFTYVLYANMIERLSKENVVRIWCKSKRLLREPYTGQ